MASTPGELELFAGSLGPDDHVALEATGNALAITRILERRVARVVVASSTELRALTEAKVKTDRLDARALARLLAAGLLSGSWVPDEDTRALRRRLARRAQLVGQRTRSKNEIHAVLMRNLRGRPPMTDVFGKAGRAWLAALELSGDERETVDGCLRQIDFVTGEIKLVERAIAKHVLASTDVRRLMTVPGVNLMTAATLMAAVGDIRRFATARKLVGYLGLDPKVRQSGSAPARHGRISKQGPAEVRHMAVEAAFTVVNTPGPMRAFYERVRARRGRQIAIVATARKLCALFWHLLTRGQDYAFARPLADPLQAAQARTARRRRAPPGPARPPRPGHLPPHRPTRPRTRDLHQAELAYRRLVADWQATAPTRHPDTESKTT